MTNKKNLTNIKDLIEKSKNYIKINELGLAKKLLEESQSNFPNEYQLINLLAQISLIENNLSDGINLLKKSLKIKKDQFLVLYDLGVALSLTNKLDEAITFLDNAIILEPKNSKAFLRKAINLEKLDKINNAIDCYQSLIELNPNDADFYIRKAGLLEKIGNVSEVFSLYEKAISIDPKNASLYIKYGKFLNQTNQYEGALKAYEKSIECEPINPGAYANIGYIYKEQNKLEKAILYLKESVRIRDNHIVNSNIGEIYCTLGKFIEGIEYYDKAITIQPDKAEYYIFKAYAHQSLKENDKAILSFDNALKVDEDYKYAFGERFYAKSTICDWSNFESEYKWIESQLKKNKRIAPPLIISAIFDDPLAQKKGAEIYSNDLFPSNNILGAIKKYPKNKKIKIGYFSGDFREHPVGYLVVELFEMHDKSRFELFAFSLSNPIKSGLRTRIENSFDEFIDVSNINDKRIANIAREKKIDIAIDLGGFTKNNRSAIFAMRVAPIQINYLGYPSTTGSSYIDYNIIDKYIVPNELQKYYSEKIIYLPKCYQPNESKIIPSKKLFSRKSEGLPDSGLIFCCFNNSWKITPRIFKLWIRLLSSVERSVLWFPGFSSLTIKNLRSECHKLGVDQDRLIFSSLEAKREDHKEKIKLADIFLDCFPYGAQSTASDFLRAGVPVITLKGLSFSNRVALSLLTNLKLSELITSTELEYEKLAIKLATDDQYLKKIKLKLIANVKSLTVYNISEYTKSIESGYSRIYDRYHNDLKPDHVDAE
jgi:predicted O-linked N-acetylglucosamine transferase (SPINDLY family)